MLNRYSLTAIDAAWVFPGPIHVQRLRDGISKALQRFPQAAGRLSHDEADDKWFLNLTDNEGVPLTVVPDTDATSPFAPDFDHQRHPDLIGTSRIFDIY